MKLYTPDDEEFDLLIAGHAWFDHVLRAERGEIFGDDHGVVEQDRALFRHQDLNVVSIFGLLRPRPCDVHVTRKAQ